MNDELQEILKNYVTREDLQRIFEEKRTASEQFIEDHDRSFRLTEIRVNETVTNMNAGLSKLNIMSDALSNIMRVWQDNYEAVRIRQKDLEDRVNRVEQQQGVQMEEYKNFYGAIFGDAAHPDQESLAALLRKRTEKADAQHEILMENVNSRFDHIEERQDVIEEQIRKWQRWLGVAFQGVGEGLKKIIPRALKLTVTAILIPALIRMVNAPLAERIGIVINYYLFGIK